MKSGLKMIRAPRLLMPGLILATLTTVPSVALGATIVVGDGTPESCTESALQSALFAAGTDGADTIRFQCGRDPVIIPVTASTYLPDGMLVALLPPDQTTIDGGGRITLRLSDWLGSLMAVATQTSVAVQNLSIHELKVPAPLPIGVSTQANILNGGTLALRNVTLSGLGDSTLIAPPGIDNYGTLNMQDCLVTGITGTYGSAAPVRNFGAATVTHTSFLNNSHWPSVFRGVEDGGAIFNAGQLAVNNSVFADNASLGFAGGGAIANLAGTVTISGSQFFRNRAYYGGAIDNHFGGAVTVVNSTFGHNVGFEAGAILSGYPEPHVTNLIVKHSTFFRNSATWGGAIEMANGKLQVENSTMFENSALQGGGIAVYWSELTIMNSDLTLNRAVFGGGIYSQFADAIVIVKSNVTSNFTSSAGGGIYLPATSSLRLVRTDVVDNTPDNIYKQAPGS
jgi:hypothetical protein